MASSQRAERQKAEQLIELTTGKAYRLLLLTALISLGACAHRPPASLPPATSTETAQEGWLNDESHFEQTNKAPALNWRYSAKIGITTPELREQANMVWQFQDQSNNVRLFGPLGAGAVVIDFDRYGVQLSDNKGIVYRGHSAEELLTRITGWPIPVQSLSHWLFVRPDPDRVFRYQLDELGNISAIEQSGWKISYSDYRDYGSGQKLPRKLIAIRTLDEGDAVSVKLITKAWQF